MKPTLPNGGPSSSESADILLETLPESVADMYKLGYTLRTRGIRIQFHRGHEGIICWSIIVHTF